MPKKRKVSKDRPDKEHEEKADLGPLPGAEPDGGESILSGRSRERHPEVPDDVVPPPADERPPEP